MSRRGVRTLSDEDRILWNRVARTAVPLPGREAPADEPPSSAAKPEAAPEKVAVSPTVDTAPPKRKPSPPRALDRPERAKLVKGRLAIDASVDLHGMTQAEAHRLLHAFLFEAHAVGMRHVLVITGKGRAASGDGILRRGVPEWLATTPFRLLVSGFDEAGARHGGGGALYVRLRRQARAGS